MQQSWWLKVWFNVACMLHFLVWSSELNSSFIPSLFDYDCNIIDTKDQCVREGNDTDISNVQNTGFNDVICPRVYFDDRVDVRTSRLCNRSATFTYPLKSMAKFLRFLESKNWKLMYVGDSIQNQMYQSLMCAIEGEAPHLVKRAKMRVLLRMSPFLSPAPTGCTFVDKNYGKDFLENIAWYHSTIDNNVTHVIFNTGAWWSPGRVWRHDRLHEPRQHKAFSLQNVVHYFEKHLSVNSTLFRLLHRLKEHHGVTLIWRDITPGGVCKGGTVFRGEFPYYESFTRYNSIARKFVTSQLDGLVIPKVWEMSLDKWRDHVSNNDTLHWCIFRKMNVPSIWNTLLYDLLESI